MVTAPLCDGAKVKLDIDWTQPIVRTRTAATIEVCVHHPIHLTAPYKSFAIVSSILSCHCGTAALWHHAMFSELTPLVWFCVSVIKVIVLN